MRIALAVLAPLCVVVVTLAVVLSLRGALAATVTGTPSTVNSHVENFTFNPSATHTYQSDVNLAALANGPYSHFPGFTLQSSGSSPTNHVFTCGDPEVPQPSEKPSGTTLTYGFGGTYTQAKNRKDFPSALAYSLMLPNYGAKLTLSEFNELMGLTGTNAVTADQRTILMHAAAMFYEFKDRYPNPPSGTSWSTTNDTLWPKKLPLIPGSATLYDIGFADMFYGWSWAVGMEDDHTTFLNWFYTILARIEALMTAYNSTASGQSTSSLWMSYDDATKRLTFGYTGYQPPTSSSYPTLSWTITGGGTVTVQKNGAGASITSGSAVDITAYYTVNYTGSGSVAFTLADDRNFLQGGSIEGYLLQTTTLLNINTYPDPVMRAKMLAFFSPLTSIPYQRMLIGHSKWVKLRCGLTVTGTTPEPATAAIQVNKTVNKNGSPTDPAFTFNIVRVTDETGSTAVTGTGAYSSSQ
ncbi:MAG: hypothetical protein FWH26_01360, partial [Oscillospiraceae bacterium]|nr:hypothetical protein [Oscillospiraceae bacterium]